MKNSVVVVVVAVVLALTLVLPGARLVSAEEVICTGTLGPVTVDSVVVPEGSTCTLNGTRVQGTVSVETDATLHAMRVRVIGDIQAQSAAAVNITRRSSVGGSVQLVQGGSALIDRSRVNGDILFDENTGAFSATSNRVGGSLQVFQNTGGAMISNNVIEGNLQCKENDPAPTGGGNVVDGNKEDQCADL